MGEVRGKMTQVIAYDETFAQGFDEYIRATGLTSSALDYHVASIIGPQSSGKSTLMNMLFGTTFNTMDAAEGRYQVTQGVWLGTDVAAPMVIMDLEGTDSRERGEDALSFERKSALFALALSEVLIVNMWMHDVGRHQAANLALLKTIIELDMQLFMKTSAVYKTKLLFVLRDKDDTPIERLVATLRTDLNSIWASIDKPNAPPAAQLEDYFQMEFAALAHKQYCPDLFAEDVADLKAKFHDGSMFAPEYARGVVADGFSTYAQSVWETVRTNQELDIPSQKKMVATVRCEQISRDCFAAVSESHLASLRHSLEKTKAPLANLTDTLLAAIIQATAEYSSGVARYDEDVAELKLQDLKERLAHECKDLYEIQSSLVSRRVLERFSKAIETQQTQKEPWHNFSISLGGSKAQCLAEFDEFCGQADDQLAFITDSRSRADLVNNLDSQLLRAEKDVAALTSISLVKARRAKLKPTINKLIDGAASDEVWTSVGAAVEGVHTETKEEAQERLGGSNGLGLATAEVALAVDKIRLEFEEGVEDDIRGEIGTVSGCGARLVRKFDESFRFDERGVPRTWKPEEDVDGVYLKSRGGAESLIEILSEFSVFSGRDEVNVFGSEEQKQLKDLLYQKSSAACMEAKRAQEARSVTSKVPYWLIGVLIVLGWNEFIAVIRNPVLVVLAVVLGPVGYVLWALDVHMMVKPLLQPSIDQAVGQGREMLASLSSSGAEGGEDLASSVTSSTGTVATNAGATGQSKDDAEKKKN